MEVKTIQCRRSIAMMVLVVIMIMLFSLVEGIDIFSLVAVCDAGGSDGGWMSTVPSLRLCLPGWNECY